MNLELARIFRYLAALFAALFTLIGAGNIVYRLVVAALFQPLDDKLPTILWLVLLPWCVTLTGGYLAHFFSKYRLVRPGQRPTDVPVLTLTGLLAPLPVAAWGLTCMVAVELYMKVPHPYVGAGLLAVLQMLYTALLSAPTAIVLVAWFLFREREPLGISVAPE